MRLSEADHAAVTAAVAAAEAHTDGEIVTVVAPLSDAYHDVALHWAVLAMLGVLALFAAVPRAAEWLAGGFVDAWGEAVPAGLLFVVALVAVTVAFLLVRVILSAASLRLALTPGATKARRVHARALALFRVAVEQRTDAATGVLIYLSLGERRAELVADAAIHARVPQETWGAAMATLIAGVREGRPGVGMAAAVAEVGAVLAEHFPRSPGDRNELSDRLVEL